MPSTAAQAPPELFNVSYDGGGSNEEAYGVAIDSNDNIIVTGRTGNDWLTIKYDNMGNELWNRTYNDGSDDYAYGVAVDSNDNVIVTGKSQNNYYTIKYNSGGTELWNATYDGGNNDEAYGVAVDSNDNVIVTGFSNLGDRDYHTIKYNSGGTELWNATYDGGDNDNAYGVAIDSLDNIIITGYSRLGGNHDYHTIKYNSGGTELWNATYDSGRADDAYAVAIDSLDNIIITGYSNPPGGDTNYYTIKYNSGGTELWNATYDGGTDVDEARGVATDSNDNIIVTGTSKPPGGDRDYYTIAYNSGGTELWNATYDGGSTDNAYSVAVDSNDCVIVTGGSRLSHSSGGTNWDFYTIKYCTNGDNNPPTTNKEIGTPSSNNGNCTTTSTPIWLNATDNNGGSGVNATYYRIWNGVWHPANTSDYYCTNQNITNITGTLWYVYFLNGSIDFGPIYFHEECTHYLEYYSNDNASNNEIVHNQTHYVDDTCPIINKTIGDPNCTITEDLEYCVTTGTVITINASDTGCCDNMTVMYRIWNGSGWSPGWTDITDSLPFPVTFSEECEHWLNITAYDCLGHQVWDNETFFVDDSPPEIVKTVGEPNMSVGCGDYEVSSDTPITINASDDGCCPNLTVEYRIWNETDDTGWRMITALPYTFTFSERCMHNLSIRAFDCLGHMTYHENETFYVDHGPQGDSAEATQVIQNLFFTNEDVYAIGSGFIANDTIDIYVVADRDWTDGNAIPGDVSGGAETNVQCDGNGDVYFLVWPQPLVVGDYDIVYDADQDGFYDWGIDAIDGMSPGFTVRGTGDGVGGEGPSRVPVVSPLGLIFLVTILPLVGIIALRRKEQ